MKTMILCAFVGSCVAASASAQSLSTDPNNNGLSGGGAGVYFDLTAGPADLTVTDLVTSSFAATGTSVSFELYTRVGTSVGAEGSAAGWNLVGSASGIVSGTSGGTFGFLVDLDFADFSLTAGQVTGIALFNTDTGGIAYTGTGGNPPVQNFANADLALAGGSGAGSIFSGAGFSPRVFSGTINYVPAPASAAMLGLGGLAAARRRR